MTTVDTWQHGDYPTAVKMAKFSTALNEAHTALGDYAWTAAVLKSSSATFHILHTFRYLKFSSTGALVDIQGVYPDISLNEDDGGVGTLDLQSVGWLGAGMLYKVTGVSACMEDSNP